MKKKPGTDMLKYLKPVAILLALLVAVPALLTLPGWSANEKNQMASAEEMNMPATENNSGGTAAEAGKKRKIKYWKAPMDPTYIRDKPGKSPMGMDLVPVYEDEGGGSDQNVIRIDPVTVQNIGVRTAPVVRGPLRATVGISGHVTYDEQKVEHIHTKISGWVEKLYVDETGQTVHKGERLLSIYSPDLVATQEEYLQALRYAKTTARSPFADVASGGNTLVEATKRKLLLMDIDPGQIEALEKSGTVQKNMVLHSPASGVVIDKKVLEGMSISPGTELYTIADISRVWVIGSVYEYELPFIQVGAAASMTLPSEPGVTYQGRITFIYPYLSARTRTAQVRIEVDNPDLKLKPDMYVDVSVKSEIAEDALQVPSEGVIRTGTRNIVITALGEGKFLPKEVEIGPAGQGMIQIKSGLSEGEMVVTSGQFLIDSESNLREAINKMLEAHKTSPPGSAPPAVQSEEEKTMGTMPAVPPELTPEQNGLMEGVIDAYLKIHAGLVAESPGEVASRAATMADLVEQLRSSDPQGTLRRITAPIDDALPGLKSATLKEQQAAFAELSKAMVGYVKGAGREEAQERSLKIFICPMINEPWLQQGDTIQNPYLGKEMTACGTEEPY